MEETSTTQTAVPMIKRIREALPEWSNERHLAVWQNAVAWGRDKSATDKAMRDCMFNYSMAAVEWLRVKRRQKMEVLSETITAMNGGYVAGRGLLGSDTVRPSYSRTPEEVELNARRLAEHIDNWDFDTLIHTLCENADLAGTIGRVTTVPPLEKILGADGAKATLLGEYVAGVALAMAEEQLFGPLSGPS